MDPNRGATLRTAEDILSHLRVSAVRACAAGEVIYRGGEKAGHLFLVLDGEVKLYRSAAGKEVILGLHGAETIFGESSLVSSRWTHNAITLRGSRLMIWNVEDIYMSAQDNPRLLHALLQTVIKRGEHLQNRLESLVCENARQRLARTLVEIGESAVPGEHPLEVTLPPVTHQLLASYIGTTREVVSQLMSAFRRLGDVSYSRKGLTLRPDRLRQSFVLENFPELDDAPATDRKPCASATATAKNEEHHWGSSAILSDDRRRVN